VELVVNEMRGERRLDSSGREEADHTTMNLAGMRPFAKDRVIVVVRGERMAGKSDF
jgi:hypothetical protein